MAGSTPQVPLPAWIVEHQARYPVAPATSLNGREEPNLVPVDPAMPDLGFDNDDVTPEAVHGPDGTDDSNSSAPRADPPCLPARPVMCPYRREAMLQRSMYDPDRTYLDVDFTGTPGYTNGFNKFAKDCGARFDWEKRLFYIPTNVCPMAALCVFPAISYARHLSLEITTYGWIPHNAGFGFLDIAGPTLGQIHF
jgi:hypothetical protein